MFLIYHLSKSFIAINLTLSAIWSFMQVNRNHLFKSMEKKRHGSVRFRNRSIKKWLHMHIKPFQRALPNWRTHCSKQGFLSFYQRVAIICVVIRKQRAFKSRNVAWVALRCSAARGSLLIARWQLLLFGSLVTYYVYSKRSPKDFYFAE